jgi:hypothetical protein
MNILPQIADVVATRYHRQATAGRTLPPGEYLDQPVSHTDQEIWLKPDCYNTRFTETSFRLVVFKCRPVPDQRII